MKNKVKRKAFQTGVSSKELLRRMETRDLKIKKLTMFFPSCYKHIHDDIVTRDRLFNQPIALCIAMRT
mgnify:CR=1 FL=1